MHPLRRISFTFVTFLFCSWRGNADSCELYRAKYEQLNIGDQWTRIIQVFGAATTSHDTPNGETAYVYEFGGCRLTFIDANSKLKAKRANPDLAPLNALHTNANADLREPQRPLTQQVADLKEIVEGLNKRLGYISVQVIENLPHKGVWLDPTSLDKYQRLDTTNGFLLISLRSVEPYLSGIRAVLNVGNPLTASFNGFKVSVKWGRAYGYKNWTAESYNLWQESLQTREESFTETLNAGSWTPAPLVLPNTAATQFGHLEVNIETNIVSLTRSY